MKKILFALSVLIPFAVIILLSCQKELSCEGCDTANTPPIPLAGPDQVITLPTDSVLLNGTASYDADGQVTAWSWTKIAGPVSFHINRVNAATTVVRLLAEGVYQFELEVTDDKGAIAKDTVQVTVQTGGTTNQPPVACAGQDQIIALPVNLVLLDGSCSTDPDNNLTGYLWTKISGPSSPAIRSANAVQTQVTNLVQGVFLFQLQVTDAGGLSSMDTVQVTVQPVVPTNQPPVACAGQYQAITLPVNSVQLDGSCSTDPNNNITGFQWSKIAGPSSFNIANPNGVQTQVTNLVEGVYLFQLQVTDAGGLSSIATVQVIVNRQTNNPPVDIYIAGDNNGMAAYWKNGQVIPLSALSNSMARAIAVVGTDVYVAGEEGDMFMYGSNRAKYWKNGQEMFLTGPIGAGTYSIAVDGGDVYVAGWQLIGSRTIAIYWKNSQPVPLTHGLSDAEATSIVVTGGNVYVAGFENGIAKYWKNNQPVSLTDGSRQAYANSIAVSGSDVYVAGSEHNGTAHVAKYWKNGQAVSLTNGTAVAASASSISVVGTDVYVAGWEGDFIGSVGGTGSVAKYWKNGQTVSLTNGATYAYAASIAIFGGDVYVAGHEGSSILSAKYWKNGQAVALTGANGAFANSILVVPR